MGDDAGSMERWGEDRLVFSGFSMEDVWVFIPIKGKDLEEISVKTLS